MSSLTPYYQDEHTTLYWGDCRKILPHLQTDLAIISDPPYGMGARFDRAGIRKKVTLDQPVYHSRDWGKIEGDDEPFEPAHLLGYPYIALFGANHYADRLPASSKWLSWDKRCQTPADDNSDFELIWTNQKGACRTHYQKWRGIVREGEENLSRAWKFHPAQKPVSLMRWVIGQLAVPSQFVICDPYMGSGSTLVAAKQLGYAVVGIEKLESHCKNAVERLRQGGLPLTG